MTPELREEGRNSLVLTYAGTIALIDIVDKERSENSVSCRQGGEGGRQTECEENGGVHLDIRLHRPARE